ncbi:NAD-dependent epimerase/dehydratase family protein [Candidatus Micrarchaeota archaeon]|nr:NAD-dependent epimerase/dehydratase family protein [Candidatus Micrarchaeota archaeon]
MRVIVSGGAGFIGSHLVDRLIDEGHEVVVIDNLSAGKKEYVNKKAHFVKKDIRTDISEELKGVETIFHIAADPDVRVSAINPKNSFDVNVAGTFSVLEACRKADVKRLIFPSTSTIYGEAKVIPTPETYPCAPISNYGASKLACEAYISSYAASYGIKGTSLRLANIFGERSTHGVMFDFYHKLKKNPNSLEILGDGKQDKSYLHISDCVDAFLTTWKIQKIQYDVFNVGSREKHKVDELATTMCKAMGLSPKFTYTGASRGWVGDMRLMLMDTRKIEGLGWKPKVGFEEGVNKYVSWLQSEKN